MTSNLDRHWGLANNFALCESAFGSSCRLFGDKVVSCLDLSYNKQSHSIKRWPSLTVLTLAVASPESVMFSGELIGYHCLKFNARSSSLIEFQTTTPQELNDDNICKFVLLPKDIHTCSKKIHPCNDRIPTSNINNNRREREGQERKTVSSYWLLHLSYQKTNPERYFRVKTDHDWAIIWFWMIVKLFSFSEDLSNSPFTTAVVKRPTPVHCGIQGR